MAVSVNATGTKLYKSVAGTSQSYTGLTIAAGSNIALLVTIAWDLTGGTGVTPTGLTCIWDSGGSNQSMTRIITSDPGTHTGPQGELWGLVNPATGNKTLALAWTSSSQMFLVGMAFNGVDQTGGTTSFPNSAAAAFVSTVTITSATGDMVIAVGGSGAALGTITGTTIYSDSSSGSFINAFSNYDVGAASVVIGMGGNGAVAGTDIKAAGGGGSAVPKLEQHFRRMRVE